MCNHYRGPVAKANLGLDVYGFEEFSQIKIDVFPNRPGIVLRRDGEGPLRADALKWGFPKPGGDLTGVVTNIRNLTSPYWAPWLQPVNRCLVPFSMFAEYAPGPKPRREVWFQVTEDRPAAFAGIWRGCGRNRPDGTLDIFAFLTTDANDVVRPIHEKAMPVILIGRQAMLDWLSAPSAAIPSIAAPLDNEDIEIVEDAPRESL